MASRARKNVDHATLRHLCERRPVLSYTEIGLRLGVTRQAAGRLARRHGYRKPDASPASMQPGPRRRVLTADMVRCLACGGRITESVAHQCRPAEPLTTGLVWTRGAA